MTEAPTLPDSPLAALRDHEPLVAAWRRRTLGVSTVLMSVFPAAVFAFAMAFGWPASMGYLDDVFAALVVASPNLLLGLIGLQVASAPRSVSGTTVAITAFVALACGCGHAWIASEYSHLTGVAASGVAGLVGDGLVLALPVARRLAGIRAPAAQTLVALAAAPAALLLDLVDELPYVPDVWEALVAIAIVPVPILGAAALLWLLFTTPPGPSQGRDIP